MNEVLLQIILVLALGSSVITKVGSRESEILGYILIGVITLAIYANLVVMIG